MKNKDIDIPAETKDKIQKLVDDALYNYDLPGLCVGIQKDGGCPLVVNSGYSNYQEKKPLTNNNIFHMASITKLFTGTAVLKLAKEGLFSLDQPLLSILPWFSMKGDQITGEEYLTISPRQILSHTAGLPDVTDYHWELEEKDDDALFRYCTSQDVKNRTLLWSPRENKFSYSNIGYELLGMVVQETSGLSFEDYVANNFFAPLQMNESTLRTYERTPDCSLKINDLEAVGLVVPYEKDQDNHTVSVGNFPYHRGHGPSSTLTAPMADVLKRGQAFFDPHSVIRGAWGDEDPWKAISPIPNSQEFIGLSWFIREENGLFFYGHEGSDDGFRSSFWICPQEKLTIVVCANLSRAPVKKINKKVFNILENQ